MPEVVPRVLLFMLDRERDGAYVLGKPALELDDEDATYLRDTDTEREERVRFSPGDEPTPMQVIVRVYGPNLEWVFIKAEQLNDDKGTSGQLELRIDGVASASPLRAFGAREKWSTSARQEWTRA